MNQTSDKKVNITLNLSDEPIFSGNVVNKTNPIYDWTEKSNEEVNGDYINVDPNENEVVKDETKRDSDILPPE